jgi:7-cyano-7-deazaguanine synthase
MVQKGVVIVSGGMDSVTLLYDLHARGYDLHALTFDYGQKHVKEIECAKKNCKALGIPHTIIDMKFFSDIAKSALTTKGEEVPEGNYDDENMKQTVVPNRNMVMLSIAAAFALSHKLDYLFYGAHSGDHAIYPDCRPPFIQAMKNVFNLCDWKRVRLEVPYIKLDKAGILKVGLPLGVPYGDTWTCYKGGKEACGVCGSCTERLEAFKMVNLEDPLPYAKG